MVILASVLAVNISAILLSFKMPDNKSRLRRGAALTLVKPSISALSTPGAGTPDAPREVPDEIVLS